MKKSALAALLALGLALGACGVSEQETDTSDTSTSSVAEEATLGKVPDDSSLSAFDVAKRALDAEADLGFDYTRLADDPALAAFREIQAKAVQEGYELQGHPTYSLEKVVNEDLAADPPVVEIEFCSDYGETKLVDSKSGEPRETGEGIQGSALQTFRLYSADDGGGWRIYEWKTEPSCNG